MVYGGRAIDNHTSYSDRPLAVSGDLCHAVLNASHRDRFDSSICVNGFVQGGNHASHCDKPIVVVYLKCGLCHVVLRKVASSICGE